MITSTYDEVAQPTEGLREVLAWLENHDIHANKRDMAKRVRFALGWLEGLAERS